jgi:CDGSH-type Zn-finger protein
MAKDKKAKIVISKNGPYLVSGKLPLQKEIIQIGAEGEPEKWGKGERFPDQENYALCRCGQSKNKPFCDGAHAQVGFDGTETASLKKYLEQAEKIEGPAINLTDAQKFCAAARFCHPGGGTWELTGRSKDAKAKDLAVREACNCPSGRLVAWDNKTGKPIEQEMEPSLGLVEDPQANASGPIWVKGGVAIESADGTQYETRNRMTLCRCGQSKNKPFCDGNHIKVKFNDGDPSLKKKV